MEAVFLKLLNMSLSAGWLVLAVLAVRLLFKKAPKWLHCLLWGLVAVRLVCPVTVESVLSLIPSAEPIPPTFITSPSPEVDTGLPELDAILNPGLAGSLTTPPENSVNASQVLAFAATMLWVVGMVAMAVYALVSTLRLRYRVRESMPLEAGVRVCDGIPSPFILGVFHPRIYLPPGLSGEQTAYVLAHERAHLKRCDHLWKPLGWLLLTVYWFNPLMWVAYVLLCRDIEMACDEKVVRDMDVPHRKTYSEALLVCSASRRLISACPLAFGETGVKQRIRSVLHYKKPAFWLLIAAVAACVAVAVCFLTDPLSSKVDEALDMLIVDTVKAEYKTAYVDDRCPCVAYTVFGMEKNGDTVTVYGRLLYQEYSLDERGDLHVEYSKPTPFTLTAKVEGDGYSLEKYWTPPKDDQNFETAIRERFPWRYQRRALNASAYKDAANNEAACLEIARGYFGIADREDYTTYLCDVNGTVFRLENKGDKCTFAASGLASYRCEGTYKASDDRVTLVFENMTLVFLRKNDGLLLFDADRSDEIPEELHFGTDYAIPDGTVFYRNLNRGVAHLFTGTVQRVDKKEHRLLLNSEEFNGQVWVNLTEEMPLYQKGEELFVVYNGFAETTDPLFVGAMRIGLRESLSFRMEYYADRVAETAVEKTATTLTAIGLEERAAVLQVVLATTKWVPDAILDRTTLYFDGFVTLSDGKTLYFDLKDGHLYNKAEGMLADLSAEGKELLGHIKTMAATATTSGSTTTGKYWPYSYPVSTRAGNPTTTPNRTPNAKGVVNIVDWTTIYAPVLGSMLETFYEDDSYAYYFNYVKSQHVLVHYADGSYKPLKEALTTGDVTIADLEDFGIEFGKTRKGTTTPPTTVKKTTTTKKVTTTTAKKEGFELQFLRIERVHPSIKVGGKDIWERFAPMNGRGLLVQIGDKIIYRIINHENTSERFVGTGDEMNCRVEISGDIVTVTVTMDENVPAYLVVPDFWIYDQSWTRVGTPDIDYTPSIQLIRTRNPVSDNRTIEVMLNHYAGSYMYCPYGDLTGNTVVEKVIPVTAGTEWIETAIQTLDGFIAEGYDYYKLSLSDNVLTIRVAHN